jgi:hypothetical protein
MKIFVIQLKLNKRDCLAPQLQSRNAKSDERSYSRVARMRIKFNEEKCEFAFVHCVTILI